jgi:glutathione synthase/RimK-type ligase-like ATP-grasp enzyme
MAEDVEKSTATEFALKYAVDEHDSLHFAQSLKELGHQVYFVNWRDLQLDSMVDSSAGAQFDRMYSYNDSAFVAPVALSEFDLVFVYKMEGFYRDSQRFNEMLGCFSHCKVINDIGTIKHNFNKSYLWQLQERDVRIIPSFKVCDIKDRLSQGERFVVKPLCGERGNEIFLAHQPIDLIAIEGSEDAFFAQQFMPEIWQGERSLVFLGDQFQHAVIKLPSRANQSEFRCNESLGGTVDVYDPTEQEIDFAKHILRVYEGLGYPSHFSRVDILSVDDSPMLLEAELLNPSMYANYSKKGEAFGKQVALYFDQFIKN